MATHAVDDSAVTRVFGVAELLENVLLHMDMRQLFVSQRVCRTWRDQINASKPLRAKLFLDAEPSSSAATGSGVANVQTNPLAPDAITQLYRYHLALSTQTEPPTKWRSVGASWRRMFLCSPSQAQVYISAKALDPSLSDEICVEAGDREAVTLEQVWDALDGVAPGLTEPEKEEARVGITYDEQIEMKSPFESAESEWVWARIVQLGRRGLAI